MYICISFTFVATSDSQSICHVTFSLFFSLALSFSLFLSFSFSLSCAHSLSLSLSLFLSGSASDCAHIRTINIYDIAVVENIHD